MDKSLLEELREAKKQYETSLVCYFNDGEIRKDYGYMNDNLKEAYKKNEFYLITETMKEFVKRYGHHYDFDTIKMNLLLGLIYDAKDINKDDTIKENATPLNGMIRFYTGKGNTYLDGEQTNQHDSTYGLQGFITFDNLMSSIKKSGLEYNGPESFEELKDRILNNEIFDITLTASQLKQEKEKISEVIKEDQVKEEQPVVKESKIKKLFKR